MRSVTGLPLGGATLTPYAGSTGSRSDYDEFTETGVPGANLTIEDGQNEYLTSELGLKLGALLGGIYPEAKIGWACLLR